MPGDEQKEAQNARVTSSLLLWRVVRQRQLGLHQSSTSGSTSTPNQRWLSGKFWLPNAHKKYQALQVNKCSKGARSPKSPKKNNLGSKPLKIIGHYLWHMGGCPLKTPPCCRQTEQPPHIKPCDRSAQTLLCETLASIISSTKARKVYRGVHPNFVFALVGSPKRVSTSVGRK